MITRTKPFGWGIAGAGAGQPVLLPRVASQEDADPVCSFVLRSRSTGRPAQVSRAVEVHLTPIECLLSADGQRGRVR
jgi:hypothetical protein